MRIRALALLLLALAVPRFVSAQTPPSCDDYTIPDGPPIWAPVHVLYTGTARLDVWRNPTGELQVLVTSLAVTASASIEGLTLTHGGIERPVRLVSSYGPNRFGVGCDSKSVATLVTQPATGTVDTYPSPYFSHGDAFILTLNGASLAVPSSDEVHRIYLFAGCSGRPCSAGDPVFARVVVRSPFGLVNARIVVGIVFPDGATVPWFSTTLSIPVTSIHDPGTEVELPSFTVPPDVPNGVYVLRAALLDPALGTTLAADVLRATKQ